MKKTGALTSRKPSTDLATPSNTLADTHIRLPFPTAGFCPSHRQNPPFQQEVKSREIQNVRLPSAIRNSSVVSWCMYFPLDFKKSAIMDSLTTAWNQRIWGSSLRFRDTRISNGVTRIYPLPSCWKRSGTLTPASALHVGTPPWNSLEGVMSLPVDFPVTYIWLLFKDLPMEVREACPKIIFGAANSRIFICLPEKLPFWGFWKRYNPHIRYWLRFRELGTIVKNHI